MTFKCLFEVKVNPIQSRLLQLAYFKAGYIFGGDKEVKHLDKPYLFVWNDNKLAQCRNSDEYVQTKLTFEQALEYALTGQKFWKDAVEIQLGKHRAFIMPGEYIKVGCTTLNKEEVEKLLKVYNKPFKRTTVAVHCNLEELNTLATVAKTMGFSGCTPDTTGNYTFYLNGYDGPGTYSYDFEHITTHPSCNVELITFHEAITGLVNKTITKDYKQSNKVFVNVNDDISCVVCSQQSIEVKGELLLDVDTINQLIKAWKDR